MERGEGDKSKREGKRGKRERNRQDEKKSKVIQVPPVKSLLCFYRH